MAAIVAGGIIEQVAFASRMIHIKRMELSFARGGDIYSMKPRLPRCTVITLKQGVGALA